jgi:hypothetical protein
LTPTCSPGADQPPRAEAAFTVRGVGRMKRRPGDAGTCRGDVLASGVARGVDCSVAGVVAAGRGAGDVASGAGGVREVDGAAVAVRVADGVAVGVTRSGGGVNAGGIVDDVEANVGVGRPVEKVVTLSPRSASDHDAEVDGVGIGPATDGRGASVVMTPKAAPPTSNALPAITRPRGVSCTAGSPVGHAQPIGSLRRHSPR